MSLVIDPTPEHIRQVAAEEAVWQSLVEKQNLHQTRLIGKAALGEAGQTAYYLRQVDRLLLPEDLGDWPAAFREAETRQLSRNEALEMRCDDSAWSLRSRVQSNLAALWDLDFFYPPNNDTEPLMGGLDVSSQDRPDGYFRIVVSPDGAVTLTIEDPGYLSPRLGRLAEHTYKLPRQVPYVEHLEEAVTGERSAKTIYFDSSITKAVITATDGAIKAMTGAAQATA